MDIKGYKAFDKNKKNVYGAAFEEGKIYEVDGPLECKKDGNGFHFCERLEDCLRYVPALEEEIKIARVTSLGDYLETEDKDYGYDGIYICNRIRIDQFLKRPEIIEWYLKQSPFSYTVFRTIRFLSSYRLTPEEIEQFKEHYKDSQRVMATIEYYQEGNHEVFEKSLINKQKIKMKGTKVC